MNKFLHISAIAALLFAGVPSEVHAQWKTETYTLRGGWNAIWLHGDATHATPAELFADYPTVLEIWRWNPNPDQIQFTDSPNSPNATSSEWTIWNREDPNEQVLSALIGQSAYLIRCSGTSSTTTQVSIAQRPRPPNATWLVSGANFLGFPAATDPGPILSSYFASFPIAVNAPAKIYKYIGGSLNATNPMQISPSSERLDRNTAYWLEAATVGDFTGPLKYELPGSDGLAFGRTRNVITVGITNRTSSAITLTLSAPPSEPAPANQTPISGPVPLTRRVFDTATGTYTENVLVGESTVTVPANGRINLEFGLDRSQLTTSDSALYGSFLRIKDSVGLSDVLLPTSAQRTSPAGLWIGQADVSAVTSNVPGSPGATTARSFPLRVNLHVDADGTTRLLSQAYVGTLAYEGHPSGITTTEAALDPAHKAHALRVVSSQMPLDRAIVGSGAFAVGSSLQHVVNIPFDDPTNPFVHAYHPDHDNRDARFNPLPAGVESYNITRRITFTFTADPPNGASATGWGTTIYGGTYAETLEGLNKDPLTVSGTFVLRRISEIADVTLTWPPPLTP
ncbi:MAG: hypothetical protein JJU05_09320 [Verrucomicrobia bacterium]|nr:hypothetical protein [Verrucomicrobiota bacterium]MCH8527590.1 hypothetical protein [Kiritimatiellia bacterium]